MSELIAIPLSSERRAVEILTVLRRLQAEYQGDPGAAGSPGAPVGHEPSRRRPRGRRASALVLAALVGGLVGAAVALLNTTSLLGMPSTGGTSDGVAGALLGAAIGGLLVATAGLARTTLRKLRSRPPAPGAPTVTWLVSYVVRDEVPPETRLRASHLLLTLPAEAEGRLKAVLARADAAAAR